MKRLGDKPFLPPRDLNGTGQTVNTVFKAKDPRIPLKFVFSDVPESCVVFRVLGPLSRPAPIGSGG